MEGQREKTSSRRRQRRKSKNPRNKAAAEPVLIVARRPDSPLLKNGFHSVVASAQPKHGALASARPAHFGAPPRDAASFTAGSPQNGQSEGKSNGHAVTNGFGSSLARVSGAELSEEGSRARASDADPDGNGGLSSNGFSEGAAEAGASETPRPEGVRRRAVRIVKLTDSVLTPAGNREQQLLDRLVRSQGRGAISRAADDLWDGKFVAPRRQEVQIQLLEHENEHRARDAVFVMAELLQKEAPIKRPVLDQRLRRLEQSAEDPITRDAAGALRRSMRVHHGA